MLLQGQLTAGLQVAEEQVEVAELYERCRIIQ
jgi:hypothetical protein